MDRQGIVEMEYEGTKRVGRKRRVKKEYVSLESGKVGGGKRLWKGNERKGNLIWESGMVAASVRIGK